MPDFRNDRFEWDESKSADRARRSGFDFHAAVQILESPRRVERWDNEHSVSEERIVATGLLGAYFISVIYTMRGKRKPILSAFQSREDDIRDYLVTYALTEE